MEFFDNTFWATVCLVAFAGLTIYFGLPRIIAKMLDSKIAAIAAELEAAKRLRAEAEALLVEYEQKRVSAEAEAAGIISAAQEDAKRITAESSAALAELVARRTKAVEGKIAQAEAQAIAEVRARSADIAVEAARVVLAKQVQADGTELVDKAIKDVASRLN
jgi:F-type H+-transporting ATPase subunit b